MNYQKLQINILVQIPVDYFKNGTIDYQQFSQWICFGQSRTGAIIMATIYYLFTSNKTEALKQLAYPRKQYTNNNSKMVAQYLLEAIQWGKKEKFFEKMQQFDPKNEKPSIFFQEYCSIMLDKCSKDQIFNHFANSMDLQFFIIGYQPMGNGKNKITLYYSNQCYYYLVSKVKQNDVVPQQIKQCWMCRQEARKFLIPACQHLICLNCLIKEFKKQEEFQCRYGTNCTQRIKKQSVEYQQLLNSQLQTSNQLNGSQSQIIQPLKQCSFCKKESQNIQILRCKHQLCQYCMQLANQKKVECIIGGCGIIKNESTYSSQTIDRDKFQERMGSQVVNTLNKQCSYCLQIEPKSEQFFNPCSHSICKKCLPKFFSSTYEVRCRIKNCNQHIDKRQMREFLNSQKIQFACCKCKENYSVDDLYFNNQCCHAICFTCAQQMIEKIKLPQFICPEKNCSSNFQGYGFEQFYEQYQMKLLMLQTEFDKQQQQMIKQNQDEQLKQIQLEGEESKNWVSRFQISNQSQLKQNKPDLSNEMIKSQNENGSISQECTMCNSPFTEYNLRQEINCSIHKIGVCCIKNFQKCQQCETRKINQSAIRPKSKLILQTLQMPNQNEMSQIIDQERQNSRIQFTQSQIRNNTTDNSLFKSQNLKNKSNYGK